MFKNILKGTGITQKLNVELPNGTRVEDVAEKIGTIFGEDGQEIGRQIDKLTKNVTIKIEK